MRSESRTFSLDRVAAAKVKSWVIRVAEEDISYSKMKLILGFEIPKISTK